MYFIGRLSMRLSFCISLALCVCLLLAYLCYCISLSMVSMHLSAPLCVSIACLSKFCISLYGQHASVCVSLCLLPASLCCYQSLWSACICLHLCVCLCLSLFLFSLSWSACSWAVKFCPSTPGKQAAQHRLLFNDINNNSNNNCTITDSISISTSSINAYMTRNGVTTITRKMTVIPLLRLPSLYR